YVSGAAELFGDLFLGQFVARADHARDGVNLRSIREDRPGESLVDDLLKADVIKGKDAQRERADDEECRHHCANDRCRAVKTAALAFRDSYLYRHNRPETSILLRFRRSGGWPVYRKFSGYCRTLVKDFDSVAGAKFMVHFRPPTRFTTTL